MTDEQSEQITPELQEAIAILTRMTEASTSAIRQPLQPSHDVQPKSLHGPIAVAAPPHWTDTSLRSLIESLPDALVAIDSSGVIVLVNAACEEMFGHGRAEMLGRPIDLLIPQRFRRAHVENRQA